MALPTLAAPPQVGRGWLPGVPHVTVRAWRKGDERLVAAAERLVSPQSMYARFFTGGHRFPPRYLERLARNITAVALADGAAVGWAEIAQYGEPSHAGDLAVLIVDEWQHHRIGPMLAEAAFAAARRRGLSIVHADVLETNRAARRALERTFGDRVITTCDEGVLHYVLPLGLPLGPALATDNDERRTS